MENLSSFLNRKFGAALFILGTTSWVMLFIIISIWGYYSTSRSLESNLSQSSSMVTAFIFERNWNLINEHFNILGQENYYTYFKVTSKTDNSLIYESNIKTSTYIPVICHTDSSSEIIYLKACAQTFSLNTFIFLTLLIIAYIGIIFFTYGYIKKKFLKTLELVSKEIFDLIEEEKIVSDNSLRIYEIEKIKNVISEKTQELKRISKEKAYVDISRKVAHDLRSPISVIFNLARKNSLGMNDLKILSSTSKSIKEISNNLLEATSSQAKLPNCIRYNLLERIESLISIKRVEYPEKDITINFEFNQKTGTDFWLPEVSFTRLFSNILNNSIEAIEDKEVIISVKGNFDHKIFVLTIEDNGPGFSDLILKKFNSGIVQSSKVNGYGLGLSSALTIMRNLGGEIKIINNENGNAEVKLHFPIHLHMPKSLPIILIENDKYIRISWDSLAQQKGYILLSFSSLEEFENEVPNLNLKSEIFMDSDLGEGILGENYIERLLAIGFSKISLQTGKEASAFNELEKLNSVISKEFPY